MAASEQTKGRKFIETRDIPVYQLADAKYINRVARDPRKDQQLRDSMASQGMLVSLKVYPEGDHYRIEDGQRRADQAKLLQWATLRCDIWEPPEDEGVLVGIVVNNVREGNTAYEVMQAALELQVKKGLGPSAIAKGLGVSEGYVKDLIAVSGLPEPLHVMLHSGALGVPAAKELLRITVPEEQMLVGRDFAERHTSGTQAESIVSSYIIYREKQKNLPPVTAAEMAQHDPLFTCELCGENKPIRGSQGKVYCGDCNRELMYLWETQRRERKEAETHQNARAKAAYPIEEQRTDTQISYTIGEPPKDAIATAPPEKNTGT
jgi:hypothetical protein